MKKTNVRELVLMAFYVALFMVLDVTVNALPLFRMPNGGSLGISCLALLMASYQLGWKKGLAVSLLSVFAMFLTGPMYTPDLLGFLLDYLLAFGVYGLASLFPNFGVFFSGVLITNLLRFFFSTLSGVIVWNVPWIGSIQYQAAYMIPTTIVTLIFTPMLYRLLEPKFQKMFR